MSTGRVDSILGCIVGGAIGDAIGSAFEGADGIPPAEDESRRLIRDVCRITHHHDEAYAGALAVVLAVRAARGQCSNSSVSLAQVAAGLPDTSVRDRILAYAALPPTLPLAEVARRH